MLNPKRYWIVGLGCWIVAIVGVGVPRSAQAGDRVIEVRGGTASIERKNGQIEAVGVGTELWVGDWLQPASGAVVRVQCDNHTTRSVYDESGLGSICPDSVARPRSRTGRGEDDFLSFLFGTFDYGTQVIETVPMLRWDGVENATAYRVQVWSGDEVLWETVESGTQVPYDGIGLELGQQYQMIVTALAGDEVLTRSRVWLRRLPQDEIEHVGVLVESVEAEALSVESLSSEGRVLALAQVYLSVAAPLVEPPEGSGLVWQGIDALEALVEQGTETPFTHQLLGNLYLQVGLLGDAQGQYERVLELTRGQDDVRTRAAAWVGLANIAAADSFTAYEQDDTGAVVVAEAQARKYLEFAVINYRVLGETSRVEKIETEWVPKVEAN